MFTDYDGNGNGFGNTLIESNYASDDITVYSSIDDEDENTVKIIVTNHSIHDKTAVEINLDSDKAYKSAQVYSLSGDSAEITQMADVKNIKNNSFTYTLPALSVTEFVVTRPTVKTKAIYVGAGAVAIGTAATVSAVAVNKKKK